MYPVTQDFNDKMKATERRITGKVQIDYTNPFLDQSIQVSANEQANISFPAQTADSISEPFAKIASLDGSWILDGTYALAPSPDEADTHQMGWWGSQLSQADGTFVSPYPSLTVTHFARPIHSLKVVGDSARGEYPVDFTIDLYAADGTKLYTKSVTGNNQVNWSYQLPSPVLDVTKQVLTITKWSHAGRQVKILEFFTSIQETYEGDDILLIHLLEEREVSQGSLPVGNISANEIDIRLDNSTRKFDAGNKQSPLYQLLKQNRRIRAWLGLKGDGDGVNVQQTVDFNQGTLNNLVVVNNKLQLPSVAAPSFTRNSIAYKDDGTLVNSNLPRYEQGQFGNAIMIEEGTTNLITNRNLNNWDKMVGDFTITYSGENNYVSVTSISGWEQIYKAFSVTSGATYTFSLKYRIRKTYRPLSGYSGLRVQVLSAAPGNFDNSSIQIAYIELPTSAGDYAKASITFTPSVSTVYIDFNFGTCADGQTIEVDFAYLQLEAKPYATSFIDGTRAAEVLKIPNPIDITKPWTIEHRFIAKQPSSIAGASQCLGLSWFDSLPSTCVWITNGLLMAMWNNSQVINPNISYNTGDTIYYAWRYDGTNMVFSVGKNGANLVTLSKTVPALSTQPSYIYIGSAPNGAQQSDVLHDDFRVSNKYRADEEIAQAYASGQPLPVDEWTTYKLGFDGNLNFGQGGSYISPEYDLSAVGTAATSAISWQEDPDGIQRSVYAKLDNQADWTQVQNGGGLPVEGDLNGRKLQIKVVLLKQAS